MHFSTSQNNVGHSYLFVAIGLERDISMAEEGDKQKKFSLLPHLHCHLSTGERSQGMRNLVYIYLKEAFWIWSFQLHLDSKVP